MTESHTTRKLAYEALLAIEKDGRQSHLVLSEIAQENMLSARDTAFFRRLVRGVLERKLTLLYVLDCFSHTPFSKIKKQIRLLLCLGIYQILYMDAIPDRAAVDETVKLAVEKGFSGLRGFVNGILRTVAREQGNLIWPDRAREPVRALSVQYSVPEETIAVWIAQFGMEKTEALCASFFVERPLAVRWRGEGKPELPGIRWPEKQERDKGALPEGVCFLQEADALTSLPAFQEGLLYIQDISAQRAVAAVGIGQEDRVLDLCAAPGGKSLMAAEQAAFVLARDLSASRVTLLQENLRRCRAENVRVEQGDARIFDPDLEEQFSVVLADVPCSGYGVAGRKPEIKYKPYRETVDSLVPLQREILQQAVRYVAPGGKLLYATCTITPEENEEQIAWLCQTDPAWTLLESRLWLPSEGPWDGFFYAVLQKQEKTEE